MAAQQRTEKKKEDADFKVPPESPSLSPLCSNDCGLSGSPSTNNMCQKCFNESSPSPSPSPSTTTSSTDHNPPRSIPSPSPPRRKPIHAPPTPTPTLLLRREVNRCSGCSRKVGLTGFRCRCGELFCADHRYSDRHDCSYDYKAAGRDAISRENPVIKAAKIVRV